MWMSGTPREGRPLPRQRGGGALGHKDWVGVAPPGRSENWPCPECGGPVCHGLGQLVFADTRESAPVGEPQREAWTVGPGAGRGMWSLPPGHLLDEGESGGASC